MDMVRQKTFQKRNPISYHLKQDKRTEFNYTKVKIDK